MKEALLNPVRLVALAFLAVIIVGGLLLMLPISRASESSAVMPAFFTSVSAVCVTGLTSVDTAEFWSPFGQGVILMLIQVGGFGIMAFATLLALLVGSRLGLLTTRVAQTETHTLNLGEVGAVLRRIAALVVTVELLTTVALTVRFRVAYDDNLGDAAWHGLFHAVSAFNNAGFALYSDNLVGFVNDGWIIFPVCVAVIMGGLGFPVVIELFRHRRRHSMWTIHTRLTVWGTLGLLILGISAFMALEWSNPATLGPMSIGDKLTGAVAGGVFPRTAGFNSIDYADATSETLAITNLLMFIGGGSAGTAGGIKITTFFLLAFVIWTEVRGDDHVTIGNRSVGSATQRQALSVALLGVAAVAIGTFSLLLLTDYGLEPLLFESISAFATVGLSAGITPELEPGPELVLMVLMFAGRVGTVTVASALALNAKPRLFRLPEERPIIG